MAICDECCCYDDNHIDGEDITEEELEKDPLYEPHRYYYWHGDIQEDYQMPAGYDCLCDECYGNFLNQGKIIEKYLDHHINGFLVYTDKQPQKLNPKWNDEEMGWFVPLAWITTVCKLCYCFFASSDYNRGIRSLIPFLLWHHLQKESLEES